jgi:ribosome-binding factor A
MGEEIRRIIGELLIRGLKDPALSGKVSVSGVEVTGDGGYATVYILPPWGDEGDSAGESGKKELLDAFRRAKGLLRKEIGARLRLRHTPELVFKIDVSQEYGRHIESIFNSITHSGAVDAAESPADAGRRDTDE